MVIEAPKSGVVGDYLYINDVKQGCYQLIEFEGDFYFISDGDRITKNKKLYLGEKYVANYIFENGDPMLPGYYEFDAAGKMILPY
jgi:hypothetical protein